jgi:hypothetical protein
MDLETAKPGLAYIMRRAGADRWTENDEGFVISCKHVGRRRRRRYLVPRENVDAAERALQDEQSPPDWIHVQISRLPDVER